MASGLALPVVAESTRASYGVVLNVIDTPYFPRDGKWTGHINLTVRNTGSQEDTFSLECTEKPQDWEVIVLETTVNVGTEPPTGPTRSTAIMVICPEMELEGNDYGVTIKATSQGDTSKSHYLNIDLMVLLVPLVRVEGPVNVEETDINPHNGVPDYREGEPGDYMTYDFRIRNIGNGDETFLISMQSPNNWWHQLQGPAFTDSLGINQTTLKRVKVKIPEDANKGDQDVLDFIATAQSDENVTRMVTVETEVIQIHMISLEAPLYTNYTYPGSKVEMDFNITNIGNGKDDTVRVRLDSLPEGWQRDFDLSLLPVDGIEIGDKATCSFSLVVPLNALNRTYSIIIEGYTSGKELPDSTLKFNITIYQEFRINLTKEQKLLTSLPGQRVVYNFTLANYGNGEDEFVIETVSTGKKDITAWCELETDNVQLADGLSKNILLYCKIPEMTKAGLYSIKVRVTSIKAGEMERIVTEDLTFSFKVGKQFALDLTIPEKDRVLIINSDEKSAEDRAALVHFNVTNRGNSRDIVEFTADFPAEVGWAAPDFMITKVMLEYGEYKGDLVLTVNAPRGAPIGEYNFSIHAESTLDPGEKKAEKSASFKVRIVRFDIEIDREIYFDGELLEAGNNYTQEGIGPVPIDIRIKNSGDLDIDKVNVSIYINDQNSEAKTTRTVFDFPAGAESDLTFYLKLNTTGTYKIILTADSDRTITEINEINNRAHVTYIIKKPGTDSNGKGEITYDLFGRTWSFTEFLLLIMAAVLILVLIGLSIMRLARHKKRGGVVETGLVDTGEYKFKEKEKATFEGLELDDYITEEEEEKETAVKTGKRKGGDYYISEEEVKEKSTERGFTVAGAISEEKTKSYKYHLNPPSLTDIRSSLKKVIPDYVITHKIGSGGFATVYKGFDLEKNEVAIKLPKFLDETVGTSILKQFESEASMWKKLKHNNVVRFYKGDIRPVPYLVTEYMDGGNLKELMERHKFSVQEAIYLTSQLLDAISYAHRMASVHRDIKPANILFTKEGIPKISDWGIGKFMASESATKSMGTKGTLSYSSPEQISKKKYGSVDWSTDIFQLGIVFYEMLTGVNPFFDDDPIGIMSKISTEDPEPPSSVDSQIPEELDRIVIRALEKRKEDRWRSADIMHHELRKLLGGLEK